MAGITVSIGGRLDASAKGALDEFVNEAKLAAVRIKQLEAKQAVLATGSRGELQIANEIAIKKTQLSDMVHRAEYKNHLEKMKMIQEEKAAASALTYSETTRATNLDASMIDRRRAEIAARKAGHSAPTYSEAPVATILGGRLPGLRAGLASGGAGAEAARAQIRALAQAGVVAGTQAGAGFMGRFMASMNGTGSGGAQQLFHVFRATFDSLASGMDPWRVLLQQAPQALQAITQLSGSFLRGLLAISGPLIAIGGIVAGIVIYFKRINSLAEALKTTVERVFKADHIAKYLQKVEEINQAQKDIANSLRSQVEVYDSVHERAERVRDLTKEQFDYERKKLAVMKDNELAGAKTDAQREAIEKKYAGLGLSLNKQERAEKLKSMALELKALKDQEIAKLAAAEKITKSEGYHSEAKERADEETFRMAAENATAYFGAGGKGEEDRAAIAKANKKIAIGKKFRFSRAVAEVTPARDAAQSRIDQNRAAQKAYNDFLDTGDVRKDTHDRVKELTEAAKSSALKAQGLSDQLNPNDPTSTAAKYKAEDAREAALEGAKAYATKSSSGGGSKVQMTEWERAGGYMGGASVSLLDETKGIHREMKGLRNDLKHGKSSPWKG